MSEAFTVLVSDDLINFDRSTFNKESTVLVSSKFGSLRNSLLFHSVILVNHSEKKLDSIFFNHREVIWQCRIRGGETSASI